MEQAVAAGHDVAAVARDPVRCQPVSARSPSTSPGPTCWHSPRPDAEPALLAMINQPDTVNQIVGIAS
ncbi:hypothetical protein WEI85_44000 [Actinomycetes bacterium KLBMP 9797]